MIAWRLRITVALGIVVWAAALPAMADSPPSSQSLTAGARSHVFLTNLATDSAPALQTCDPNAPDGGFVGQNLQFAALPGFAGTIYQGDVINRCTVAASDVSMLALFLGPDRKVIGATAFEPDFGVLAPGAASPFVAISLVPRSQISAVVPVVMRFTAITAPLPVLTLKLGTPSSGPSGLNVPYEVRNTGSVAAGLPRVAGRLNGSGCDAPFAVDFVGEGSTIPPGGSAFGNLAIGSSCDGIPTLEVGSDAPLKSGLPAGLSFAAVHSFYTGDGVLHVIANVCNNSGADVFLPQFRAQFSSPAGHLTFALAGTGIYSGNSCAPLLATVPGAPAGITFEALDSPGAQSAALTESSHRPDLEHEQALQNAPPCSDSDMDLVLLSFYSGIPFLLQLSEPCLAALRAGETGYFLPGSTSLTAAAEVNAATLITFAYNNSDVALSTSAYRTQSLGFGNDGSLLAGIDFRDPPAMAAHGWGIGVAPLDANVIAAPGPRFRVAGEGFAVPK